MKAGEEFPRQREQPMQGAQGRREQGTLTELKEGNSAAVQSEDEPGEE